MTVDKACRHLTFTVVSRVFVGLLGTVSAILTAFYDLWKIKATKYCASLKKKKIFARFTLVCSRHSANALLIPDVFEVSGTVILVHTMGTGLPDSADDSRGRRRVDPDIYPRLWRDVPGQWTEINKVSRSVGSSCMIGPQREVKCHQALLVNCL